MKLGIDFGTTRIVAAAVDRGNYPLVKFDTRDGTTDWFPSLVALRGAERRNPSLDPSLPLLGAAVGGGGVGVPLGRSAQSSVLRPDPYTAAALIGFLGQLKRHFRQRRATISGPTGTERRRR